MVDYVIPANDDAIRAVKLITSVMANAIIEANGGEIIDYVNNKKEENATEVMQKALETVKKREERPKKENKPFKKQFNKKDFKKEEKKQVKEETKKETKVEENKVDLESLTVAELRDLAKEKEIKGYSTMKKAELLEALK